MSVSPHQRSIAHPKKGQPVKVGLVSLGTRKFAEFPEMVPGAGLEPARLAAGDFESPESTNFTTRAVFVKTQIMAHYWDDLSNH